MENPAKLLIVDDERVALKNLEHVMKKEGYEVVTADSAEKGLAIINEDAPDLIALGRRTA